MYVLDTADNDGYQTRVLGVAEDRREPVTRSVQ